MKRVLLVAIVLACGTAEAQAQWGYQGGYYPQFYGRNVYTIYDQDRIPYYALHPPVYYSQPVPRTYGHSPFAYPGNYRTPEIERIDPVTITNPYFDDDGAEQVAPGKAPGTPPGTRSANPQTPQSATPREMKAPVERRQSTGNKAAQAVQPLRITNPHSKPIVLAGRRSQ